MRSVLLLFLGFLAALALGGWIGWSTLDGAGAWIVLALAVVGAAGITSLLVVHYRDTTKAAAAATALRQSQTRFHETIRTIDEAFALFDSDDRLVMCNDRYLETFPSLPARDDLIGQSFEDITRLLLAAGEFSAPLADDDPEAWLKHRLQQHRQPRGKPFEQALSGGRWLQVSERPTRDGGVACVLADITALKEQEQQILHSKEQFQSVVDEQGELICRFLPDGTLTMVNQPFAAFYGVAPNALIGTKLSGFLLEDDTSLISGMMEPISPDNPVMEMEQEVEMPDGGSRVFWWRCRGFFDAEGTLREYQCVGSDITTMKRQQEQLEQKEESLTRHIRDLEYSRRTLQEQGEQLAQLAEDYAKEKDRAEDANLAKSHFLSSMSHELRTPLNAILGFGQLLVTDSKEPLSASQKENVDQILKAGEHLFGLINEVLDLSKIESGKVALDLRDVATGDVIAESLSLTEGLAERHGIGVVNACTDAGLEAVWADHSRFRQVLLNLLSNAVKYNKPAGTVTVGCAKTDDGMLRITVADTGPGIPKDKHGALFEPFSRLGAESTDIEGTGIGLTITRQLAELMRGRIGFESRVGRGSTFWIDLPLAGEGAAREEAARISQATKARAPRKAGPGSRTVLYVEDNPANLKLMEEIIRRVPDISLLSAHSAELGLELAQTEKPNLIIMDINLPGMDGYQALEHLHAHRTTSNIPVIALSANAMPGEVEKGLLAGFHTYLTKPIKIDEVLTAIEDALIVAV